MASLVIRVFIFLLFLLILIDRHSLIEGKPRKKQPQKISNCSVDFLWEALSAASRGNQTAAEFLRMNLSNIGFTVNGIIPHSVAANWQSKLSGISHRSIFSQLQKLSVIKLINWPHCENCQVSPPNEVKMAPNLSRRKKSPDSQKRKHRHNNSNDIKYSLKAINKLFEPFITQENLADAKRRNMRLRRLLISVLKEPILCTEKKSKTNQNINSVSVPAKKKKKMKNLPEDIVRICLLMIEALLKFDVCDAPPAKFLWTFNETRYHYDTEGEIRETVTVPIP